MLQRFRTYQLAVQFHQLASRCAVPAYLRDQLLRASSSVVLNLAEGSGKTGLADKRRFFSIALGSFLESCAALDLSGASSPELVQLRDVSLTFGVCVILGRDSVEALKENCP